MKIRHRTTAFALGILILASGFQSASADTEFYDFTLSGDVELGFRAFLDAPSDDERGKLEEYRDLSNPFVGNMRLIMLDKAESYLFDLEANKAAGEDQSYFLRGSKTGLYKFEIGWDQIPHIYSTISPRKDEIGVRWDTARFGFSYTPTPEWDISTEYSFTDRHGEIPKGLALGFPPNLDFIEVLQPIDYEQHDVKLTTGLAKKNYQLQLSYNFSMFDNDDTAITVPTAGGLFGPRATLPPDNQAHSLTLAGGVNLPYRTRVNGALTYSMRLQTEDFITDPSITSPRESDLDGLVNIVNLYLSGTSHPIKPLTLKAMYRLYHYNDRSDEIAISDLLIHAPFNAVRFPYTKHNAALSGQWKFELPLSLNLGFNWERWERDGDVLEVALTDEYTPSISLDYNPLEWLLLRLAYSHSSRLGTDYRALDLHPPGNIQQLLTRKFMMADRERDRIDFTADFIPFNTLTISTTAGLAHDDYSDSEFGLIDNEYWAAGADLMWRPIKRLSFNVGYLHEEYNARQRSFLEVDIDPGSNLNTEDSVDTIGAGVKVALVPEKLDLDMRSSVSYARSDFKNDALPRLENAYNQNKAYLRYQFTEHFSANLGYIFEIFSITDSFAENVAPDPTIFVGDFYKDYTAHIIVGSLGYRF